jgi:subtilisin family serine protease
MASKKKPAKKASPRSAKYGKKSKSEEPKLPPKIFAHVSPSSIGGTSMFEGQEQINSETVMNFASESEVVQGAVARLQEAGFEILQVTPLTINIAGTAATYRKAFDTNIVAEERPTIKEGGRKDTATFLDSPDTRVDGLISTVGTAFADTIEGIAIETPRYPFAASMYAPLKSYWHLRIPGDVSLATNADRAHRAGITGRSVKVVMCDSGWFKHPYFVGRGYRAAPVVLGPGAANPLKDESGHGTGESANIFAVAPDVEFTAVKMSFVNSLGAFNVALGLKPHIITCSWGSSTNGPLNAADQALAASIAAAVASGIIVIFSAGNGHAGFPGQHPDVISAGGVFMNPNETLQASNYASGFLSKIYQNRRVPDVCGLVGMKPRAAYIMLPVEPGDKSDVDLSGGTHPNGDETANNDGWAAFSGTSAAAPQLAGVAALIKQACPKLKPADVRHIMMKTARDVTTGNANSVPGHQAGGHPATVGPDLATGHGLVDAHKAVLLAKLMCVGGPMPPIAPPITVGPPITVQPPITIGPPITPIQPGPITPLPKPPITPPVAPIVLPAPEQEIAPRGLGDPPPPGEEGSTGDPPPPGQLSAEDLETLGELITNGNLSEL